MYVCMLLIQVQNLDQANDSRLRVLREGPPSQRKSMSALFWAVLYLLPHLYCCLMSTTSQGVIGGRRASRHHDLAPADTPEMRVTLWGHWSSMQTAAVHMKG